MGRGPTTDRWGIILGPANQAAEQAGTGTGADEMRQLPNSDERLRYSVTLMIKHPRLDPARISQELGIDPDHSWAAGEDRRTPAGSPLPGKYPTSYWAFSTKTYDNRCFFDSVAELLNRLEAAPNFIRSIADGGGTTFINVGLFGGQNIGDAVSSSLLARFVELKVGLGIEVFPRMD